MKSRTVPFLDLRVPYDERMELLSAIEKVFIHGRLVLGPEVDELERKVASYCSRRYAVGVNSGTDALFLGLKALGIGPRHEVITTSLSWIATANSIALSGAKPVFADIDDDLNIDPRSVLRLISPATKAIMPVHYTGKICKIDQLAEIATQYGLELIEDASQAFNARLNSRIAGSFGSMACFSLNPMKIFAACGEAGIILTDNETIRDTLIALRYNGTINKEICIEPSLNGRLDTLQAAVLLARLPRVDSIVSRRRKIAARYRSLLDKVVKVPQESKQEQQVYYTYTIQAHNRDHLREYLASHGVETKIQHPLLMPQQKPYNQCRSEYTNAERIIKEIVCIPCHEKMTEEDADYVAEQIISFYRSLSL